MSKSDYKLDRPVFIENKIWVSEDNTSNIYVIERTSGKITNYIENPDGGYRKIYGCIGYDNKVIFLPGKSKNYFVVNKKNKEICLYKYNLDKEYWSDTYATYKKENILLCLPFRKNYLEIIDLITFNTQRIIIDFPFNNCTGCFTKRYVIIDGIIYLGFRNSSYILEIDTNSNNYTWRYMAKIKGGIWDICMCGGNIWILSSENRIYIMNTEFEIVQCIDDRTNIVYEYIIPTENGVVYCLPRVEKEIIKMWTDNNAVETIQDSNHKDINEFVNTKKLVNYGDIAEDDEYVFALGRISNQQYLINKKDGNIKRINISYSEETLEEIKSSEKSKEVILEGIYRLQDFVDDITKNKL